MIRWVRYYGWGYLLLRKLGWVEDGFKTVPHPFEDWEVITYVKMIEPKGDEDATL